MGEKQANTPIPIAKLEQHFKSLNLFRLHWCPGLIKQPIKSFALKTWLGKVLHWAHIAEDSSEHFWVLGCILAQNLLESSQKCVFCLFGCLKKQLHQSDALWCSEHVLHRFLLFSQEVKAACTETWLLSKRICQRRHIVFCQNIELWCILWVNTSSQYHQIRLNHIGLILEDHFQKRCHH